MIIMKRHEEVFCPKCKARGYRVYNYDKPNDVEFKCKFCNHTWKQNTLLEFTDNTKKVNSATLCICGGKLEFSKIDGRTFSNVVKCNKCGFTKTE